MRSLSISIARSRKAVSPVIATIIIVAIAISIAIAVAYWMVGITGAFTRFEKLEIVSAYTTTGKYESLDYYNISMRVKNTGTTDVTISLIFINGKPFDAVEAVVKNATNYYRTGTDLENASKRIQIATGQTLDIWVFLPVTKFGAGQSVEVSIHTAGGKDYPKNVVLP